MVPRILVSCSVLAVFAAGCSGDDPVIERTLGPDAVVVERDLDTWGVVDSTEAEGVGANPGQLYPFRTGIESNDHEAEVGQATAYDGWNVTVTGYEVVDGELVVEAQLFNRTDGDRSLELGDWALRSDAGERLEPVAETSAFVTGVASGQTTMAWITFDVAAQNGRMWVVHTDADTSDTARGVWQVEVTSGDGGSVAVPTEPEGYAGNVAGLVGADGVWADRDVATFGVEDTSDGDGRPANPGELYPERSDFRGNDHEAGFGQATAYAGWNVTVMGAMADGGELVVWAHLFDRASNDRPGEIDPEDWRLLFGETVETAATSAVAVGPDGESGFGELIEVRYPLPSDAQSVWVVHRDASEPDTARGIWQLEVSGETVTFPDPPFVGAAAEGERRGTPLAERPFPGPLDQKEEELIGADLFGVLVHLAQNDDEVDFDGEFPESRELRPSGRVACEALDAAGSTADGLDATLGAFASLEGDDNQLIVTVAVSLECPWWRTEISEAVS